MGASTAQLRGERRARRTAMETFIIADWGRIIAPPARSPGRCHGLHMWRAFGAAERTCDFSGQHLFEKDAISW